MQVLPSKFAIPQTPTDVYIVGAFKGSPQNCEMVGVPFSIPTLDSKPLTVLDQNLKGLAGRALRELNFKGEVGESAAFRTDVETPAEHIVVVGLGEKQKFGLDAVRRASAIAIGKASELKAKTVSTTLHGLEFLSPEKAALELTEASLAATYRFDVYKSKQEGHDIKSLTIVEPFEDPSLSQGIENGISLGSAFADARSLARDIMNEPPNYMTPSKLAHMAENVANRNDLQYEIFDKGQCEKLGMRAFLAVAKGSEEPPKFIVMKYIPKGKPIRHIALVGKGVTFDSGGLSLKSNDSMQDMKFDKGGAAAVIGTMSALSTINPGVQITAIIPAVENMPSGSAVRPGDIVCAMNEKTIEIMNTDAEGRLILADAIAYAVSIGADEIIDIATLTGAVETALGQSYTGVMTNNQSLADKVIKAGNEAGEPMWQLPLCDDYREDIKSKVADIKNIGAKGMAGAQAGAVFLEEFTGQPEKPWVHLDIAGSGFPSKRIEERYGIVGPPGVGVRTLINYLTNYA